MFNLCTNENHSYKHNEQINNQNINNYECFGVKFVKIYPERLHNNFLKKYGFGRDFFYMLQYFWQNTVFLQ